MDAPGRVAGRVVREGVQRDERLVRQSEWVWSNAVVARGEEALAARRGRTGDYAEWRYGSGRLAPVADALWQAANGYLDLLAAQDTLLVRE